jgi:4'-phosphopantetheinyl transferase
MDSPAPASEPSPAGAAVLLLAELDGVPESSWAGFEAMLATDERVRLAHYRREPDRRRFLLGRALLRTTLGAALALPPATVALAVDAHGKPHCPVWPGHAFSLSHAGNRVVLAVAAAAAVGVDVEAIDPGFDRSLVIEDHYSPGEQSELRALPPEQQPARFFRQWTLKEAYGKAAGTGIVTDLRRLEFEPVDGQRFRRLRGDADEFIWAGELPGYALALVVLGGAVDRVEGRRWPRRVRLGAPTAPGRV